jgi:hypothetical protein
VFSGLEWYLGGFKEQGSRLKDEGRWLEKLRMDVGGKELKPSY